MPKAVSNLVLYAVSGQERRPLISVHPDDPKEKLSPLEIAAKVNAAAVAEFSRCERSGAPHPRLKFVRETRAADEAGRLTVAEYCECGPDGRDAGEVKPALDEIFSEGK